MNNKDMVNKYMSGDSIFKRFLQTVEKNPKATAINYKGETWSYEALAQSASAISDLLRSRGIGKDDCVGIAMHRTPQMIAALLGVLANGSSYVPLDLRYPEKRVQKMAHDANCAFVFVSDQSKSLRVKNVYPIESLSPDRTVRLQAPLATGEISYIIFTSGSTGQPKGVAVKQSGVLALLDWAHATWTSSEFSCVLASTSISFDVSVFEIFAPLTAGGQILLVENVLELIDHPSREQVSLVSTVPSAMMQILRVSELPTSVRSVCIAGEPFPMSLARALVDTNKRRVFNLYGPTEDTVFSIFHELKPDDTDIPIGKTITGTTALVMTNDGEIAKNGEKGELFLAGAGVAAGYIGRPDLTSERFVPDPANPHQTMYRTGDYVFRDKDGLLHYIGREDQQIKLRGFRIELDEIQTVVENLPDVFEAVVQLISHTDNPCIAVWLCPQSLSPTDIRKQLSEYLPAHMVPTDIIPIKAIPRLPNGKLDRASLPQPKRNRSTEAPPQNELEHLIADIFTDVLGLQSIGRKDNFLSLGGNSLSAISVIVRLREALGSHITLKDFFNKPCVADIASLHSSADAFQLPSLQQQLNTNKTPTPQQEQMWIIDNMRPGSLDYLTALLVHIEGVNSIDSLVTAIENLVNRHVSLHSTLNEKGDVVLLTQTRIPIKILDKCEDPDRSVRQALCDDAKQPITLGKELPLRVMIASNGLGIYAIGFLVHHMAIDGWSFDIIVSELAQDLAAQVGATAAVKPLPINLQDYSHWLKIPEVIAFHQQQLQKRLNSLRGTPQLIKWPEAACDHESGRQYLNFPNQLLKGLVQTAQQLNTTPFVILAATFAEALSRYLNIQELTLGTAAVVRRHPELERTIACLTNLVPMRMKSESSFSKTCAKAHSEVYDALDCAEIPFSKLVDALNVPRQADRNPLVQVTFGIETASPTAVFGHVSARGEEIFLGRTRLDLTVWMSPLITDKEVRVAWTWREGSIGKDTAKTLHANWLEILQRGIESPDANWTTQIKQSFNGFSRRKPLKASLVNETLGEDGITWRYQSSVGGSVLKFLNSQREQLRKNLNEKGAILLRGFELGPPEEMTQIVEQLFSERVIYGERSSPRSDVRPGVYTSTDHPADQSIVLHNEQSYTLNWPMRIMFRCDKAATIGGATPIADMRKVLSALPASLIERFTKLGVAYQRNYLPGIGVTWQQAFGTTQKHKVSAYCEKNQIQYEWIDNDHLRTYQVRPALRYHPETGELLFFNHALFFHLSSLPPTIAKTLSNTLPPQHLPTQTFWGDGTEFSPNILQTLRHELDKNTVRFSWQTGDILILDNMRIAHGRDPFEGPRSVLVAMADPVQSLYGQQQPQQEKAIAQGVF